MALVMNQCRELNKGRTQQSDVNMIHLSQNMRLSLHVAINHALFLLANRRLPVNNPFINALNIYADISATCVTNDGRGLSMWSPGRVATSSAARFSPLGNVWVVFGFSPA